MYKITFRHNAEDNEAFFTFTWENQADKYLTSIYYHWQHFDFPHRLHHVTLTLVSATALLALPKRLTGRKTKCVAKIQLWLQPFVSHSDGVRISVLA